MFFLNHKTPLRRYLLVTMVCFLPIFSQLHAQQDLEDNNPRAENWYQVEVILFDQHSITGTESAPTDLDIGFPTNWLELSDQYPNSGIMRRPIFDPSSTASISQPKKDDLTARLSVLLGTNQYQFHNYNHGSTLVPESSIPYQNNRSETPDVPELTQFDDLDIVDETDYFSADTGKIGFVPVYEQPYQILSKKFRDLNDTARALKRRKYTIRFHEAWRFQIDSKEKSPWVIVKTEQQLANRQIIEGSIRFYKSRYLHFETNLWRINFLPSQNMEIVLPEIPQQALNSEQKALLKALEFSNKLSTIVPNTSISNDQSVKGLDDMPEGVEAVLNNYNLNSVVPLLGTNAQFTEQLVTSDSTNNYPIKEIWPIRQSKRIQEDEVYYIDHPQMGALVTIKSFEPLPINLPSQEELSTELSESEIVN